MGYDVEYKNILDIIDSMASSMVVSFYPESIRKRTGYSMETVLSKLQLIEQRGFISARYTVKCPEDYCDIQSFCSYNDIVGTEMTCTYCGQNIIVDDSDIFLDYVIDSEYIKDKKKIHHAPKSLMAIV